MLALFFFNDTATTEIYTLSLHDALPIYECRHYLIIAANACIRSASAGALAAAASLSRLTPIVFNARSEEHTSELQSHLNLVCRLLLEKKNKLIVSCLNCMKLSAIFRLIN